MLLEPTITFRGLARSEPLETPLLERIRKLETFYRPITSCRVLIEIPEHHHESGNRVHVRIDVTVPGEEIVVNHLGNLHATAQDLHQPRMSKQDELDAELTHALVAIRRAFATAGRRLQDYGRRQRGDVKRPLRQPIGRVARLFPNKGYGFLEADEGREVYFHRRSVLGDGFDRLAIGTRVRFAEETGERGPQASTVKIAHARHLRRRPALSPE